MCQPKDKGGKRCSVHQAGSKFSMRVAKLKTGADDAIVKETFTELTKEGRPLPTPSKEEVNAFIEKKRFATELDPELDDHERKIALNQLARAEKEVDSVTGASFHAWKNLRKRVSEKMKAIRERVAKPLMAFGLAGAVLFGAAGCGAQDTNNTPPAPAPTSTSAPTENVPDATTYGDLVPSEKTIDEYGEYTKITVSPEDDSMTDFSKIDSVSIVSAGFTEEEAIAAQQWTAQFAAEELIDSIAVDGQTGWNTWVETKADTYLDPSQKDVILLPLEGSDRTGLIVNNPNNKSPLLARDGKPREANGEITINSVDGYLENGSNYIKVVGTAKANYRFTAESALELFRGQGYSDDEIKAAYPEVFEAGEGQLPLAASFSYYLSKKESGGWQISGYSIEQINS